MVLHAYVGKDILERRNPMNATQTFQQIFVECPIGYRFAVGKGKDFAILLDFWKVRRDSMRALKEGVTPRDCGLFIGAGEIEIFRTVKSACVAAILRHEVRAPMRLMLKVGDWEGPRFIKEPPMHKCQWKLCEPNFTASPAWLKETPSSVKWALIGICAVEWVALMGWLAAC